MYLFSEYVVIIFAMKHKSMPPIMPHFSQGGENKNKEKNRKYKRREFMQEVRNLKFFLEI